MVFFGISVYWVAESLIFDERSEGEVDGENVGISTVLLEGDVDGTTVLSRVGEVIFWFFIDWRSFLSSLLFFSFVFGG